MRLYANILPTLLLLFLLPPSARAQQSQAPTPRLTTIEVSGLNEHTREEVIAASGLHIGQPVDAATLDQAAQKLLNSGFFKNVSYHFRTTATSAAVTFDVVEATDPPAPVVFDNFVWFTHDELFAAIRRAIPGFQGVVRDEGVDAITEALAQLLEQRNIQGQVRYMASFDLATGGRTQVFTVEGAKIPVCSVRFPGAVAIPESELIRRSGDLVSEDYRQSFVILFTQGNLIPMYRERAYLRAAFSIPETVLVPSGDAKCPSGVNVTVPVTEGARYYWDKADWSGNDAFTSQELSWALGMKPNELANGPKIEKGFQAVSRLYGTKGYLQFKLKIKNVFDDANHRVSCPAEITEGPQYLMGTLTITGVPDDRVDRLREKWTMHSGDVFNASYADDFVKKHAGEVISGTHGTSRIVDAKVIPDPKHLIADVTITFR